MTPWTLSARVGGTLEEPVMVAPRRQRVRETGRLPWGRPPSRPTRPEETIAGRYCDLQVHEFERAREADLRAIQWANRTRVRDRVNYAVGILDGEACFHDDGGISVGNTNYEILCRLQLVFGGRMSIHRRQRKALRHTFAWKLSIPVAAGRVIQSELADLMVQAEHRTPKVSRTPRRVVPGRIRSL